MNARVNEFITLLNAIGEQRPFKGEEYANKLASATGHVDATRHFRSHMSLPNVGQDDSVFDGEDFSKGVSVLAAAAAARGLVEQESVPGCFKRLIDNVGLLELRQNGIRARLNDAQEKRKKTELEYLAKLMPFLFGDHINR